MHYVRVGIDISSWTLEEKGNAVTFSVWDFAGQTVYYNTHQVVARATQVLACHWDHRLSTTHHAWLYFIVAWEPFRHALASLKTQ